MSPPFVSDNDLKRMSCTLESVPDAMGRCAAVKIFNLLGLADGLGGITQLSELALSPEAVDPAHIVAGSPAFSSLELGSVGGAKIGVWEMTPGTVTDTEVDELFIVVDGEAEVEFIGSGATMNLRVGSLGQFSAGAQTRWTVTRTLRKLYLTTE